MPSLNARLLVAATLVLAAFLGLTGFALDRAFRDSAFLAVKERLQTQIYSLLAAAHLDQSPQLVLPGALPETRFSMPGSGLYGQVSAKGGKLVWRSRSALGIEIPYPTVAAPGEAVFSEERASDGAAVFAVGFAVDWEVALNETRRYVFYVAETRAAYDNEVAGFRKSLWGWLLAAALVLLAAQGAILRWSLAPLRRVAWEVNEIEAGHRQELEGAYPSELRSLTENLNALVRNSKRHLTRYRNALGDLAHSLKTPLAVMRTALESDSDPAELRLTLGEQLERIDRTVHYQLQRAVASGRTALVTPVNVREVCDKLIQSFKKVYAERPCEFRILISPEAQFYGDEGDLMEILGNLMDNACKWCRSGVKVSARLRPCEGANRPALELTIEDDGPGIPSEKRSNFERGVRHDSSTAGHGIGLAVVKDLVVEVYGGEIALDVSPLGGTLVRVFIPF
ncbi:MAG: ATP-binding protein [Gammaproteobacteria bacterium]